MGLEEKRLNELYHTVIRKHDQSPYKFANIKDWSDATVAVNNPMCGDQYQLFLSIGDNKQVEVGGFFGYGCSISKAAGSVLLSYSDGKSKEEILKMLRLFLSFVEGGNYKGLEEIHSEWAAEVWAFGGVQQFPSRKKCVVLIAEGYLHWLLNQG